MDSWDLAVTKCSNPTRGVVTLYMHSMLLFCYFSVPSQEPWPSLPPLLLWTLLLPEGPLWQRWTLSAGGPTGGSQGSCQSSPTGGSSELGTGPLHGPSAVLPVKLKGMWILSFLTCFMRNQRVWFTLKFIMIQVNLMVCTWTTHDCRTVQCLYMCVHFSLLIELLYYYVWNDELNGGIVRFD